METTGIATLILDRRLRIEGVTPHAWDWFNIHGTDTGRPLTDFDQWFAHDHLIEDVQSVLDTAQPIDKELENEEGTWFLLRLSPYRTVDGMIDGVVITFVDTTALKTAQSEAEHEREYAVDIVDTVWEPLLVLDEGLCVESANDSFYKTFQVPPEKTAGRLVYELGNGQWNIPELRQLLEDLLPKKEVVTDYYVEHEFEDIGRRVLCLNARWVDQKQLILLAIEDITEQRNALQKLQAERNFIDSVVDTVGALIIVTEVDGRIVRFNKECEAVSGYTAAEAEGKDMVELLVPPEDEAGVRSLIEQHRAGMEQSTHENHWVTKEGERRLIRWSSNALQDEDGQARNIIGTGIDITERRQMEREMVTVSDEERRRIGQDLHDMLASQLAGVAMMTRTLIGTLDAGEAVTADELQKVADLIDAAGEQARTLSHSLMPLEVQENELAGGLRKLAQRQEEMTVVSCSFEVDDAVPQLSGEIASHLYRIAAEAINNATKHARSDAISIRLHVEGDRLVLRVEDDGVGIPETLDPTNGIGLHMMQYRAELMGARLEVRPSEEGGTVVWCSVPLESVRRQTERPAEP